MPFVNFLKTSSVEVHILLLESSLFFFLPYYAACWILVPWPGIRRAPIVMKEWILNRWTTREAPERILKAL